VSLEQAGSASYPFLGGVVGFANTDNNISPGSYQYSYLAGVLDTPEGPATANDSTYSDATGLDESSESAIWSFDPSTATLSPQWINEDGCESFAVSWAVSFTENCQQPSPLPT
jgi:hypothetical protein